MPDVKNINQSGRQADSLNNQIRPNEAPRTPKTGQDTQTKLPVGQPADARQPANLKQPVQQKVLPDAATGRDATQLEAAKQLSHLGGASATERLLGLDLRPTMTGALAAPPGNNEFLRHLSPQARRTIMRKMLNKQRERMRRLARYLRDRRDDSNQNGDNEFDEESFLEVISEPLRHDYRQIQRATSEIDKTARMLDILDEMLAMQDYAISQIGTFTQG